MFLNLNVCGSRRFRLQGFADVVPLPLSSNLLFFVCFALGSVIFFLRPVCNISAPPCKETSEREKAK
jgi:hypothetical protein